jgi:hypothetical protein
MNHNRPDYIFAIGDQNHRDDRLWDDPNQAVYWWCVLMTGLIFCDKSGGFLNAQFLFWVLHSQPASPAYTLPFHQELQLLFQLRVWGQSSRYKSFSSTEIRPSRHSLPTLQPFFASRIGIFLYSSIFSSYCPNLRHRLGVHGSGLPRKDIP